MSARIRGLRPAVLTSLSLSAAIACAASAQAADAAVDSAIGWSALTCCCCCPLVIAMLVAIILIGLFIDLFSPGVRPRVVTVNATGTTVDRPAQPTGPVLTNCKSCGAPVDESHEFCTQCGTKIKP